MKLFHSLEPRLRAGVQLAVVAVTIYAGSLALGTGADPKANEAKPEKASKSETKPAKKPAKRKLTGAEVYAINCNRCHPERYPTEFTAAQWNTIMLEMRVRANLPAEQARALLKYLQGDSGTP